MSTAKLDDSWRIVIVATSTDVRLLEDTLGDVEASSYGNDIEILAIDDAYLRSYLRQKTHVTQMLLPANIESGCYWSTVLSVFQWSGNKTIFLRAGARVPMHWDARLIAAGQRVPRAVAVAPLCARHPILSAFDDANHAPQLSVDEVDQWLNDYVDGREFVVPVLLESCLLLQGPTWPSMGRFKNDCELLDSLRQEGQWLLATDQLYIDDSNVSYSTDIDLLPRAYLNAYRGRHPLTATRHALLELSGRGEKPAEVRACLPVQLHVGHSWGGGLGRWMEDYVAADGNHNHLVLRSIGDLSAFGQKIVLYSSAHMRDPLRTWVLSEPIMSTTLSNFEYASLLEEIITEFSVESLMISSVIGHSLDLLRTSVPTSYVFHDFFPFCPALYATFGSPCQVCSVSDLRKCGQENPLHSFFKLESDEHWLSVRAAFIGLIADERVTAIVPSLSVGQRYGQLEPALLSKTFNLVEHGLAPDLIADLLAVQTEREIAPGQRLKIVLPGRLSQEKGGELLAGIIDDLTAFADLWLLGAGDSGARFEGVANTTVVSAYEKAELGSYLREINPDMSLLISVVPETFSYTLSEMWAAGIPVLATRLGAFADRIVDGENGWLVDIDGEQLLSKIRELAENREALQAARMTLSQQAVRTATEMATDYNALEVLPTEVPLARYYLPRKSYQNPYKNQRQTPELLDVLQVDHQLGYRDALIEFLSFTTQRLEQSPRVPGFLSLPCRKLLMLQIKFLSRKKGV